MSNELTNNEIDSIVNAAENASDNNVIDMRDIKNTVDTNPNAELVVGEAIINDNGTIITTTNSGSNNEIDEIDAIAASFENQTANISLFDIGKQTDDDIINSGIEEATKKAFDLTDEEVFRVVDTISNMRKDSKYPIFANLPEKIQVIISKLAYDNKIPVSGLNDLSRMILNEFIKEAGVDNALIDLEKAIDEALQIPSLLDMYTEHTKDVMDNLIPQTIERIKDDAPEEAAKLEAVRDSFKKSYDFSFAKNQYESSSRLRKAIRRYDVEFKRCLDLFNYMNEKSNFKMNDVHHVPNVLTKILIDDPITTANMYTDNNEEIPSNIINLIDLCITEEDIKKFCILICKSCENKNPNDVIDAAYMYYMVRNIIALRHTQETKTDFAVELINNICDTIIFIRDKESVFNESNMDKSKYTKKHNKN